MVGKNNTLGHVSASGKTLFASFSNNLTTTLADVSVGRDEKPVQKSTRSLNFSCLLRPAENKYFEILLNKYNQEIKYLSST